MNEEAKELLQVILKKDVHDLTNEDKAFLRARSEYLTKDEQKEYASLMKGSQVKVEEFTADNMPQEARNILGNKDLDEVSTRDLKRMAQRLDIVSEGVTREDLLVSVGTKLGPEAADKPE